MTNLCVCALSHLKSQSEYFFWFAHSAKKVHAERFKLDIFPDRTSELGRDKNFVAQRLA
jgi:hypothetical protein